MFIPWVGQFRAMKVFMFVLKTFLKVMNKISAVSLVVLFVTLAVIFFYVGNQKREEVGFSFGDLDNATEEGFFYASDLTTSLIAGGISLVCRSYPVNNPEDPAECTPVPEIPYSVLERQGFDEFFIRSGKVFPYRSTLCADIDAPRMSREWIIECLRRNGVDPDTLPPLKVPPSRLPPPAPEGATEYISVLDGERFYIFDDQGSKETSEQRLRQQLKIPYTQMPYPRARRGLGFRITRVGLQSLEDSLEPYINTILGPVANCKCEQRLGNDTCISCCNWEGTTCCYTDPLTGGCMARCCRTWCNYGQCPPGAGPAPPSPCPGGIPCPAATCPPEYYQCNDNQFGDCAQQDTMSCGTYHGSCNMVGGTNPCGVDRCYDIGYLHIELADCANMDRLDCTPRNDNNCGNDGLAIDIRGGPIRIENFLRLANYVANIPGCPGNQCNTTTVERECNRDCNRNQTCDCRCCDDSQAGCGLLEWPPGCPCCDNDIRASIRFDYLAILSMGFLVYGPADSPYITFCGTLPGSYKRGYPGEWLHLCACVQDVGLGSRNAEVCRADGLPFDICGSIIEDTMEDEKFRCTVARQLNNTLRGAIGSLSGTLPVSAMESLGACDTTDYDLGIYPEMCAGASLNYSYDYLNGGAGLILFFDVAARVMNQDSCVIGQCPQYPTQVPASICGNTSAGTNVHNCLPDLANYDIGLFIQQEVINQLLYIAWTQGYLCQSFNIPPEVAKVIIPGLRQIFPASTTVRVTLVPVCTNPTPTFQTGGGSSFTLNIPEFRVRFTATPPAGPAQNLFELQVSANISGFFQRVTGGCHPLDVICQANPTFRCRRCTSVGQCQIHYIPYGGGWLQITNFQADPTVFGVVSMNPAINLTPPYTEIGDLIGNLLGGLLDQAALRTRIYNLVLVPLRIESLVNAFGFYHNALVVNLDLPDPFCLNFLLEFGNFAPDAQTLERMLRDNYWPSAVSPLSYMLESGEISEEEYNRLYEFFRKDREESDLKTYISVYEVGSGGERLGTYAEYARSVSIRIPFGSRGVRVKLKAEFKDFYPDGSSEVRFAWRRKNGYFWYNIDGDEFFFRPITRYEEIELFAFLEMKSRPGELPKNFIVAYDKFPAVLVVQRGLLEGRIIGPDRVRSERLVTFEVRPEVDGLYYSVDGGESWIGRIDGSRFSVSFPKHLDEVELQVVVEKGKEIGFLTKRVKVEGERKGCGHVFDLISLGGLITYALVRRRNQDRKDQV